MSYITKTIARSTANGDYIEVTAQLRDDSGELSPGFSVTASVWEKCGGISGRARKRLGREEDSAGCQHELVLKAFPKLAPIVKVHLADPDGVPMHALANGWYFYSGAASSYEHAAIAAGRDYGYSRLLEKSDHQRAAEALNIEPEDLPEGMDREAFVAFVDSLTERWRRDADEARRVLDQLVDGDGVEEVR